MQYPDNSIITLDHVWKRYDNKVILKDVNLDIQKGDFVAVTGPNGGGKTTLLRIILRLLNPTQGKVTYHSDNMEVKKLPIGYLPQKNLIDSRFPITVRETVASGLLAEKNMQRDECNKRIAETISLMGLDAHSDASIGDLSGGQLQRTLLGRALISNPEVLVLDEPLSYIDKAFEQHLYDIIADVARNTTIILVSHEMSTISGMANRHIIVDHSIHECHASHHYVHSTCDEA